MRAMILAAGLGTRLRPLTNDRPKALVEVDGRTMLEITLRRLASFGIRDVIVNVHHFADRVIDYLKKNGSFGMRIEISREDVLLDTGGGLKKAAWFFLEGGTQDPFILHNVDVISTIDLAQMFAVHRATGALATLAVQKRETSRYLLFDENDRLCGRQAGRDGALEMVRPETKSRAVAFSGIHVISPQIFSGLTEDGIFSIVPAYLRLAALGEKIIGFPSDEYYWRDLGKPESIARVEQDIREGLVRLD